MESNILRRIVYISASYCFPPRLTRVTRLVPGIPAIDLFKQDEKIGNSSESRSFPVLAEGLLAPHESSDPHFLVYLWPSVLVLALTLDCCTALLFMSIILLLKDIELAPSYFAISSFSPGQFYPIPPRSIPHHQMHVLSANARQALSLAVAFGETHFVTDNGVIHQYHYRQRFCLLCFEVRS